MTFEMYCIRKRNYISKCLQAGGPVVKFKDYALVSYHKGPDFPVLTHLLNLVRSGAFDPGKFHLNPQSRSVVIWMLVWPLIYVSHPTVNVRVPAVPFVTCSASWVEISISPAHPLISYTVIITLVLLELAANTPLSLTFCSLINHGCSSDCTNLIWSQSSYFIMYYSYLPEARKMEFPPVLKVLVFSNEFICDATLHSCGYWFIWKNSLWALGILLYCGSCILCFKKSCSCAFPFISVLILL